MTTIAQTSVSLRFFGDDLDPKNVTTALGVLPTRAEEKGQLITNVLGDVRTAGRGSWCYTVERRTPGDLDGQIKELFDALTNDLSIWRLLAGKYAADLFVGMFLSEENEGVAISATSLEMVSSRGLALEFDVYSTVPE